MLPLQCGAQAAPQHAPHSRSSQGLKAPGRASGHLGPSSAFARAVHVMKQRSERMGGRPVHTYPRVQLSETGTRFRSRPRAPTGRGGRRI